MGLAQNTPQKYQVGDDLFIKGQDRVFVVKCSVYRRDYDVIGCKVYTVRCSTTGDLFTLPEEWLEKLALPA